MAKIHHREKIVDAADRKLFECITGITKDLTTGEFIRVISCRMNDALSCVAKYAIREERHPKNPDIPGGLEE